MAICDNPLLSASSARQDEWKRVNDLLPWYEAPEWARFAVRFGSRWYWMEKPPTLNSQGKRRPTPYSRYEGVFPQPRILSTEHLFRRPGPAKESGITRLLKANVPVCIAGKAGVSDEPERAALLAYGKVMDAARRRYGSGFDEVIREALQRS